MLLLVLCLTGVTAGPGGHGDWMGRALAPAPALQDGRCSHLCSERPWGSLEKGQQEGGGRRHPLVAPLQGFSWDRPSLEVGLGKTKKKGKMLPFGNNFRIFMAAGII